MPPLALSLPLPYRLFFLSIEPISTIIGAYYAHFRPLEYLQLTHLSSSPTTDEIPVSTTVVLSQLANLYLLFAVNEGLVLRCTSDLKVWRTLLFGLLIADLGHLFSVKELGGSVYWDVRGWNKMDWGNVGFVYAGMIMRICFLLGVGIGSKRAVKVEGTKEK